MCRNQRACELPVSTMWPVSHDQSRHKHQAQGPAATVLGLDLQAHPACCTAKQSSQSLGRQQLYVREPVLCVSHPCSADLTLPLPTDRPQS